MRYTPVLWVLVPIVTFMSCSSYNREATTAADVTPLQSDARKKIKTADLRCRVPDVLKATASLEHLVLSLKGVVEESNLENEIRSQHTLPLSADSIRLIKRYTPVANLTLRIPAEHLDSVVTTLTTMAGFIDYRKLKDQDVSLEFERNEMKNEITGDQLAPREIQHTQMNKELEVAEHQASRKEAAIDRRIENLAILEQVAFSTITVQLFQPEQADIQVVANPEKLSRPAMGTAITDALHTGANVFRAIFLFLLQLWPLWLLGIAIRVWYKKYYRKAGGLRKI